MLRGHPRMSHPSVTINMKKFKSSLEVISSSLLKFINGSDNCFDPAAAGESNPAFDAEKFEENANFFLIVHSLLNINKTEDYKVNGELIKRLDLDKLNVSCFLTYLIIQLILGR